MATPLTPLAGLHGVPETHEHEDGTVCVYDPRLDRWFLDGSDPWAPCPDSPPEHAERLPRHAWVFGWSKGGKGW